MRGPRHGPRTPPALLLSAPAARRLCGLSFPVAHLLSPTRLDMAPALPPPCPSPRPRRAASAPCPSRLLLCSSPRASTWPPHSPRLVSRRAHGAPLLRSILLGWSFPRSYLPSITHWRALARSA